MSVNTKLTYQFPCNECERVIEHKVDIVMFDTAKTKCPYCKCMSFVLLSNKEQEDVRQALGNPEEYGDVDPELYNLYN